MSSQAPLLKALHRTCELLAQSVEAVYSPLTPEEVRANLLKAISALEDGSQIDMDDVSIEFAPTSTIQEIAMANGWHDEFMTLAREVDRYAK